MPVLREHPNELVREQYIQTAAGTLGIDHGWFKSARGRSAQTGSPGSRAVDRYGPAADRSGGRRAARRVDRREEDVLRWAIHEPELVADWIDTSLFVDPIARAAFEQLSSADELHDALARARVRCGRC